MMIDKDKNKCKIFAINTEGRSDIYNILKEYGGKWPGLGDDAEDFFILLRNEFGRNVRDIRSGP